MATKSKEKEAAPQLPPLPMPASQQSAEEYMQRISERLAIAAKKSFEKERLNNEIKANDAELERLGEAMRQYAEYNRTRLVKPGKLEYYFDQLGLFEWIPTKRTVITGAATAIYEWCKRRGKNYKKFVRIKVEVNKQALNDDPKRAARVPGVSQVPGELFVIQFPTVAERLKYDPYEREWLREPVKSATTLSAPSLQPAE